MYLLSDGLRDQKGNGKLPYGAKQGVHNLLVALASETAKTQEKLIDLEIKKFRNNIEQTDDITIVGFQLPDASFEAV